MTKKELREHPEYQKCMGIIKAYRPGFKFTMDWTSIPKAKGNALKIVLQDAEKAGYVELVAFGISLEGECADMTYRRTEKEG